MKLLLLDGNSILNRAFYGIKLLTAKDGSFTNAVYGFFSMLRHLLDETVPDCVVAAFDVHAPTFRHKAYDGYKATRKGMPPELAQQLPVVQDLLKMLGYPVVTCPGYEADDILGTLSESCRQKGWDCIIATGDRDSLQLVNDRVTVRITATKMGRPEVTLYDLARIRADFGIEPKQLIEVKALQGDSSDNIPGVAGIGPKGALELIRKYHDVASVYAQLDALDIRDTLRNKLIAGKESAELSHMLGTICLTAPVDTELTHYARQTPDALAAIREFTRLECFTLIDRFGLRTMAESVPKPQDGSETACPVVRADCATLLSALKTEKSVYFICEYTESNISALYFAGKDGVSVISAEEEGFADFCRAVFASDRRKVTHDTKPFYTALAALGIEPDGAWFDTALAAYLLNPSASGYALSRLLEQYQIERTVAAPEGEDEALLKCAAAFPEFAERIASEIAENGQQKLLEEIEIPLAKVLSEMEQTGFEVDGEGVTQYGALLEMQIELLQSRIYEQVGFEFNINSPKQLGEALFETLGIPGGKKTKSGYSTAAEVLEDLKDAHPVVQDVLEYRTLAKLKSTYCDGLTKVIGADGRIHSSFNQMETRTGRISSAEPNLQNIPTRTEAGRELRRYFRAKAGWTLIDADYSQIELRVLAHAAQDAVMIEGFRNQEDIHRITAAQVFDLPPEMVTPMLRSRAKAVNFGIIYGIGAFSLAKDLGISRAEADRYIKSYLAHYPGIAQYMADVVAQAKDKGYAETMFGRRRYLPELSASNHMLRSFGERVARNMPIQGAAADIIKMAMIRVRDRLRADGLQARLILQVHDELIVEAPEGEAVRASKILQEEMENAVALSVPLTVDAHIGRTWLEAKD